MPAPTWVALDGDDTLWHSEVGFQAVEAEYRNILGAYVEHETISPALLTQEVANLEVFGYGVKAMTLSMIETAIEITDGTVSNADIARIVELGRWLLCHPVELLDGVSAVVPELATQYQLLLITKGDLLHQERKVAESGLAPHFVAIEIVSEKDPARYAGVLSQHGIAANEFVMVGNSLRSDVAPVLELGGRAVHIPHGVTWAAEHVSASDEAALSAAVPVLASMHMLPAALSALA